MCAAIDEAIPFMRENKIPVTKKNLAEEIGVSERAMYADYIKAHLLLFAEFNPTLGKIASSCNEEGLRAQLTTIKAKNADLIRRLKEVEYEKKELQLKNDQLTQRYQRLLGVYQEHFGDQITYL